MRSQCNCPICKARRNGISSGNSQRRWLVVLAALMAMVGIFAYAFARAFLLASRPSVARESLIATPKIGAEKTALNRSQHRLLCQYQRQLQWLRRQLAVLMPNCRPPALPAAKRDSLSPEELTGLRQLIVGLSNLLQIRRRIISANMRSLTDGSAEADRDKSSQPGRKQNNQLSRSFGATAKPCAVSLEKLRHHRTRGSTLRGRQGLADGSDWPDFLYALLAAILEHYPQWSWLHQQNRQAHLSAPQDSAGYLQYAGDYLLPCLLSELNREIKKQRCRIPYRTTLPMPGVSADDSARTAANFLPVMSEF